MTRRAPRRMSRPTVVDSSTIPSEPPHRPQGKTHAPRPLRPSTVEYCDRRPSVLQGWRSGWAPLLDAGVYVPPPGSRCGVRCWSVCDSGSTGIFSVAAFCSLELAAPAFGTGPLDKSALHAAPPTWPLSPLRLLRANRSPIRLPAFVSGQFVSHFPGSETPGATCDVEEQDLGHLLDAVKPDPAIGVCPEHTGQDDVASVDLGSNDEGPRSRRRRTNAAFRGHTKEFASLT